MIWFNIDDIVWGTPCDIQRVARREESGLGGMMLNGLILHDVIGVYFDYEIRLAADPQDMAAYYELYSKLTEPVSDHDCVLPFDNDYVDLRASVENLSDGFVKQPNGEYWKGTQFRLVATTPTYYETVDTVWQRGLPALPDIQQLRIGDTYTYTANGWTRV